MSPVQKNIQNTAMNTAKIDLVGKIVNGFQPFIIFAKSSIFDIWLGSECASAVKSISLLNLHYFSFIYYSIIFLNSFAAFLINRTKSKYLLNL